MTALVNDANYHGGATGTLTIANLPATVTSSGFVYNRASRTYNGTLTVTIMGTSAFAGTLTVQLNDLAAGVTLVNPARISNGAPQLVKAPAASLNPGQSVTFPIQFNDPSNARITFNPAAFLN